jgi:hypothetical protein
MVHQNSSFLVVNLGVNAGIANEVHNPFLSLVLVKAKPGGEIPMGRNILVHFIQT